VVPRPRSRSKNNWKIRYSTPTATIHGSAINRVNAPNVSPLAVKASRLVKLDTGSSSEPELARWVQA
jgi:hypothetical protein